MGILDVESFIPILRAVEARLPDPRRALDAIQRGSIDEAVSEIEGTMLETVLARLSEERRGFEDAESELIKRIAALIEELRRLVPEELENLFNLLLALIDVANLVTLVGHGGRPPIEALLPMGEVYACWAEKGGEVLAYDCLASSPISRFVERQEFDECLKSRSRLLEVSARARLGIMKSVIEELERLGVEPHALSAARTWLAIELAKMVEVCRVGGCIEELDRASRSVLGIEADISKILSSPLVDTRSCEEAVKRVVDIVSRSDKPSAALYRLIAEHVVKPLTLPGEGPEMLLALFIQLYTAIAVARYVYWAGASL